MIITIDSTPLIFNPHKEREIMSLEDMGREIKKAYVVLSGTEREKKRLAALEEFKNLLNFVEQDENLRNLINMENCNVTSPEKKTVEELVDCSIAVLDEILDVKGKDTRVTISY